MKRNVLKTKDGKLTAYAFSCGYQVEAYLSEKNRLRFRSVEYTRGIYEIIGRRKGTLVCEVIVGLKEARKRFKTLVWWTKDFKKEV